MIAHGLRCPIGRRPTRPSEEDVVRVPTDPIPGRSLVTRRALVDIVRIATLGSYGVTGFAGGGPISRLFDAIGLPRSGIRVTFGERIEIELDLTIALGLPVAEVARQVDSAVRYAIRRALDREVDRLTIHIDGLRFHPGSPPPRRPTDPAGRVRAGDLADSGTDVA
jgi:uncharacterized alkaline shock family protein YloU